MLNQLKFRERRDACLGQSIIETHVGPVIEAHMHNSFLRTNFDHFASLAHVDCLSIIPRFKAVIPFRRNPDLQYLRRTAAYLRYVDPRIAALGVAV